MFKTILTTVLKVNNYKKYAPEKIFFRMRILCVKVYSVKNKTLQIFILSDQL